MSANESVRVMVRFRPSNEKEKAKADSLEPWRSLQNSKQSHIKMNDQELRLTNIETHGDQVHFRSKEHKFYFDSLMPESTTQSEAFNKVALKTCDEIIQGYNGTIFVYGQSGSGKTHTMYGPEDEKDSDDIEAMGVIPQSCAYIFGVLNNKNHKLVQGMQSYVVQCEFIEIYNEVLRDLLNINSEVKIRQRLVNRKTDEWVVDVLNVERRQVSNLGEVLRCIREASKNRTVAGTNLNATSSRSHMVMRLFVRITTNEGVRTGIANFSDLAGSEKVKKTGATGDRLEEAKSILLSLSTLSRVIEALTTNKHPPFQESKLTFLLKDSLGGNCKTTLLIAASPHVFNRDETVRSLRFGETCRKIQNAVKKNVTKTRSQLVAENEELKKQIAALKRSGGRLPHSASSAVDDDDDADKRMQLEREKYEARIQELQALNERYCEQMKQSQSKDTELDELSGKYSELERDLVTKNEQYTTVQQELTQLQQTHTALQQQHAQLSTTHQTLSATSQQLAMDKQRLQQQSEQQSAALHSLRQQFDKTQRAQTELQQKWKSELDSKKSQFSQQEMELSQQIEQLQLQIAQDRDTQSATTQELAQSRQHAQQVTTELHSVQDEHAQLQHTLHETQQECSAVRTENEALQSQLQQAKLTKAALELQKNEYRQESQTQMEKMNALEYEYEQQSQTLRQTQKRVKDSEKEHKLELQRMMAKMQAIVELNEQLQQENKMAIEVLDDHQQTITKHKRQLTNVQHEKQVIVKQNERLQSYYNRVVQQQIEKDSQLAQKLQMEERDRLRSEMSKRVKGPMHADGDDGSDDDDEDDSDALLPGSGVTAGGPMQEYQAQIMRMKLDESNESEVPKINQNESKNKNKNKKAAYVDAKDKESDEEESGSDDELDLEEEQNAMFSKANKWKRESAILRQQQLQQQQREQQSQTQMQMQSREEIEAKMQEFERQRQDIAAQYDADRALAQQMHASQLDKHRQSWNQYGMPGLQEAEQENLRKQKEWEERRRKFIEENFVAANKIPTHTPMPLDQEEEEVSNEAEKKRRRRKNNANAENYNNNDDDEQRLIDPNDGMGKIVIFDPTLDDEYE